MGSSFIHLIRNDSNEFFFFCSEFCHILKWNGLGFTCVPRLDPPAHLPLYPLPPGLPIIGYIVFLSSISVQFSLVAQWCLILCDPMNCSMPRFPVHHQLLESTQTHVHWVSDAIQPSHPLSSPCPPAFNLTQDQNFFQWVSSLYQVVKVLEFQLQHQSFQWLLRTDFLLDGLVGSPLDFQESSPTPQIKSINSLVLSFL